jgi:hypothetical protein
VVESYIETKAFLDGGWGEVEDLGVEFWGGVNLGPTLFVISYLQD